RTDDDTGRDTARIMRREAESKLGLIALERGEKERGFARLATAAGPPPPTAETEATWYTLGNAALELGDLARAEEAFRTLAAAAASPGPAHAGPPPTRTADAATIAREKSERLIEMAERAWERQPQKALAALAAAEDADPTWARAAALHGAALEKLGQPDEAAEAYRRALARDPGLEAARAALDR